MIGWHATEAYIRKACVKNSSWRESHVAVFGNNVERCFDIVAGVDGA